MYFAYVLTSLKTGRLYKGSCEDLAVRVLKHNKGQVKSTKPYKPWTLIYSEEFETRGEAFQREHYWKTATGARELKSLSAVAGLSSEP